MLTSSMLKILISSSPVGTGHTPPFFSASVHVKTNPIIRHNRVSMMDVLIIGKIKLWQTCEFVFNECLKPILEEGQIFYPYIPNRYVGSIDIESCT